MRLKKIALRNIAILASIAFGFIACEEDFASVDSDIINDDTALDFDVISEKFDVISYTNVLDPVQTNGLGLHQLGIYSNTSGNIYGTTSANIVSQVNTSLFDPTFGKEGPEDPLALDSVVLTIPLFSTNLGLNETGDGFEYQLDSVFPKINSKDSIKLSIFENNYFLRDFNPDGDFDDIQIYYSDGSVSTNEEISQANLESREIAVIDTLLISNEEILLTDPNEVVENGQERTITERLSPRIRKSWVNGVSEDENVISYWKDKILNQEGNDVLRNSNNFNNYFRGLYFKAEPTIGSEGSLVLLNLADPNANITLYYSFDSTNENDEDGREQSTYTLTFGPTQINILNFQNNGLLPTSDGDDVIGDEKLYLKGGEGSVVNIKLFNGENIDEDDDTDNAYETWRHNFAKYNDETGEFESFKRLINEANLIFYVDQQSLMEIDQEPSRLYLYNRSTGGPLADYFVDTQNNSLPLFSIPNHLGILERDDDGNGVRYKMKITQHIINLLTTDLENSGIGLAVSGNVNLEATVPQYDVLNPNNEDETVPVSSIITPRGTVLFGNNTSEPGKKLELEIIYSEPSTN